MIRNSQTIGLWRKCRLSQIALSSCLVPSDGKRFSALAPVICIYLVNYDGNCLWVLPEDVNQELLTPLMIWAF